MKKVLFLLIVVTLLGLDSCKKKGDPAFCTGAWATEVSDELTAAINAAMAYSTNPNTTTCNAYKTAMSNYIDALDKFSDCSTWTAQQKADLNNAIDDAREDLENACAN
jgi:hypothetical protein